ncbi:MAG: hypothetical protein NTY75_03605 [Candidatus Shapirobacteria bacterium]|nr:hypothetical protein [Candidatus Shapirobacteria bacterium]
MSSINSIDLHLRTYRSALKSNLEITVNSLTNSHLKMESILHPLGNNPTHVDLAALVYCLLRLPSCIDRTRKVIMGQSPTVFATAGFPDVLKWSPVTAPARRRSCFFNPNTRLTAAFISSISDVDDLVNSLIAFQTEWNKFHLLTQPQYPTYLRFKAGIKSGDICRTIGVEPEDWQKFIIALGPHHHLRLRRLYKYSQNIRLQLLAGSWVDYTKTVQRWWKNIAIIIAPKYHISHQTIYFISSNDHSLLNTFTGFPLQIKPDLLELAQKHQPELYSLYQQIRSGDYPLSESDFFYYLYKHFSSDLKLKRKFNKIQDKLGIISISSAHYLDVPVQIFPLKNLLKSPHRDPRLKISKPYRLQHSPALIFNIDYPLGFASYHVLNEILENVNQIKGIYILGKAAVLNSELGDIEIPRLVFDEQSQNTYMFNNCFNHFFPFANSQGSILTNQKSVSVLGTFLENEALLKKYMANNITVIEMEAGPYLSAISEATYDQQLPHNTIIDLNSAPLDIGIINYTSDTPYSKAKNLGAGQLDLHGIEPVYLGSLAILQRIINLEEEK